MKIYTRTGDAGDTGLFGGGRVPKDHARVEAYGAVDELNAALGWALTLVADAWVAERLAAIQPDLFSLGAHLATPPPEERRRQPTLPPLPSGRIGDLERWMDRAEEQLPALRSFVMPGGSPGGAALHLARTICRRAERRTVGLARQEDVAPEIVVFLNRLSDLLFMLARLENQAAGAPERPWRTEA